VNAKLAPVNVGPWILYADRSSMDKQLLVIPFLRKSKNTDMVGG
jgi:hypothetical protein